MTQEELEALIKRGDMAVADTLESFTEAERKKLSKAASMLLREMERYEQEFGDWADPKKRRASEVVLRLLDGKKGPQSFRSVYCATRVAVLGLCPISVTRKIDIRLRDDQEHGAVVKVLSDRRPDWINEWIRERIKGEWPSINWETYWTFYKAGICDKPIGEDYYRFMASQLNGWAAFTRDRKTRLSEFLNDEPELHDDIWELFEIDTVAFAWDWGEGKDEKNESWPTALYRLADRGVIDRGRLLDASLSGLTTGLKQNLLSGFAKFHERLDPTPDEIVARQMTYADLLSVKVNQVVSFAIKMLKKIDQAKRLDDVAFVSAARSVFDIPTKGPAKSTLTLLKKIAKRSPDLQGQIADVLVESALLHPADDIVVAAIELIDGWREQLSDGTIQSLSDTIPNLPAVAQTPAREMVAAAGGAVDDEAGDEDDLSELLSDLRTKMAELDENWRRLAGVDDAIAAIESRTWPGPLEFTAYDVPVLSGVESVTPIESIDELRDVIAHAVEQVDSAMDFERILDGISRLGRDETDEFKRLSEPLIKRIGDRPGDVAGRGITDGPAELVRLLGWWLGANSSKVVHGEWGWPDRSAITYRKPPPVHEFLNRRCKALRKRLAAGHRGPLLSMPTHQSGWIDPLVFVEQWIESVERGVPILKTDVVLGLLRLAPDHRAAALKNVSKLNHPWASALRWALGDDDAIEVFTVDDADIWIAAANARGAEAAFGVLPKAGAKNAGPNGSAPATYEWNADVHEWKHPCENSMLRAGRLKLSVRPQPSAMDQAMDRPSVMLHAQSKNRFDEQSVWMIELLATIQPSDISGLCASGVTALMYRIDDISSAWEPNHPYLRPLFDIDRPLDDVACLLLVVGLVGRDQDVRGLAIDAAVEAIQDGRLHPEILGRTLATLATPGWLKLNRLCPNLAEVARISPVHAWVVCESLQTLLGAFETLPRDAHHLLSLLQELLTQLGGELEPSARETLAAAKGGGKTAKLAKSLLKLAASPTRAADEARLQVLQTRVDRAKRWQSSNTEWGCLSF